MKPRFEDPAEIKFVNKKFILATNDKKNPVQIVRQLDTGDENNVIVSLSNGDSYQEYFDSLQDLIGVTSNKAWQVTFCIPFKFIISHSDDPNKVIETFARLCEEFLKYAYTPLGKFYLPENRMIPRRFSLLACSYEFNLDINSNNNISSSNEASNISFMLIAPEEVVKDVIKEAKESIFWNFRHYWEKIDCCSSFLTYTPNSTSFTYVEVPLEEGVAEMKAENVVTKEILLGISAEYFSIPTDNPRSIISNFLKKQ